MSLRHFHPLQTVDGDGASPRGVHDLPERHLPEHNCKAGRKSNGQGSRIHDFLFVFCHPTQTGSWRIHDF